MSRNGNFAAPGVRAVIFDFGEVLCDPLLPEHVERMARVFGITPASFTGFYERDRGLYDRGDLSPAEYWGRFATNAGSQVTPRQIEELRAWDVEMWSRINPMMTDWLARLHAAGITTGLLSNMHCDMVAHTRRSYDWVNLFDYTTFSSEVRLSKPEPGIYEHTVQSLGVPAGESLFIDDREVNIRAAQAAGLKAIRYRSTDQLREDLQKMGFSILPATAT